MKLSINLDIQSYDILIEKSISNNLSEHLMYFNEGQKFILCFSSNLITYVPNILSDLNLMILI